MAGSRRKKNLQAESHPSESFLAVNPLPPRACASVGDKIFQEITAKQAVGKGPTQGLMFFQQEQVRTEIEKEDHAKTQSKGGSSKTMDRDLRRNQLQRHLVPRLRAYTSMRK